MTTYRALIVEDAIDVRRALKAALELLMSDFTVADVPSAEEGLLEFFRQPVDLLITDMRLPGITGLELMERMRARKPELKVILVTGLPEPELRTQALAGGANAFFFKPLDIPEFLETIRGIFQLQPKQSNEPAAPQSISEWLARLRLETSAHAVILLSESGKVMAQAGDSPDFYPDSNLIPALMTLLSATHKVSLAFGRSLPSAFTRVAGEKTDLYVAPVGHTTALLILAPAGQLGKEREISFLALQPALQGLMTALAEIGIPVVEEQADTPYPPAGLPPEASYGDELEHDPALESLVVTGQTGEAILDDIDAFWENLDEESGSGVASKAEVLTYEEARRLGLAPDQ